MYQKEIIYMGLHKNGSRVGSAGFLKAEKKDKTSTLTMVVKNIPHAIEGRFPVRYCLGTDCHGQISETGGADDRGQMAETGSTDADGQTARMDWKEEDGITLRDGGGVWEKRELEDAEWIHVQILLPNGYLVEGESKAAMKQVPPKAQTQPVETIAGTPREFAFAQQDAAAEPIISALREPAIAVPQRDVSGAESIVSASREPAIAVPQRDVSGAEPIVSASREPVITVPQRDAPAAEQAVSVSAPPIVPGRPPLMADALAIEGLKENKWEQILDTYDRIHPYGDSRVYVKLAPKDFIILSSSCQHLVNNSFLLHGFYNYRYVILGKREKMLSEFSSNECSESLSEEEYCLGVPGVYYEREKMVALMFGFEAFECEGGEPKPGDFGYYLRKVTL